MPCISTSQLRLHAKIPCWTFLKHHHELQDQLRASRMDFAPLAHSCRLALTPLQTRGSLDSRRSPPSEELLSPLATLYPHVTALQPQYDPNSCSFTGYHHTGYWAAAYTSQPLEESSSGRNYSGMSNAFPRSRSVLTAYSIDTLHVRFVSKLRRLLSRDDLKQRRGSA